MSRKLLISIHLYLAAFFAPIIILIALSGGLYLNDEKGTTTKERVYQGQHPEFDPKSQSIKADVESLLATAGVTDYQFEYVRVGSDTLYTRPTSKNHYVIKFDATGSVDIALAQPDFQASIIELHKGHGPQAFKTFQKVFAVGCLS